MNNRLNKINSDKLYYIDSEVYDNIKRVFKIVGSTGNIYDVTISDKIFCTCPDNKYKKNRCKHIYFVIKKILKFDDVEKNIFTIDEINNIINKNDYTNTIIIPKMVKTKYELMKNNIDEFPQIELIEDLCPICLDNITNGEEIIYCKYNCGKGVHKDCLEHMKNINTQKCMFCGIKITEKPKIYNKIGEYINIIIS